jgi:predicted adenine nucleotide alpha hydrolase (AANH) superfamily ATPase
MERILVHVCCASCASYVLPHLRERFAVTAYFYNPNIHPEEEYILRRDESRSLCGRFGIPFVEGPYEPSVWWRAIDPYHHLPERSERCWTCYHLRIDQTASAAEEMGIARFTTTLSVSPHKIFRRIEAAGEAAARARRLEFVAEDFKKKDGFKISVQRSRELGLTRQDYCGCSLSLEEARERRRRSEGS